ncbi:MAG: DUF5696 domain-containing protein [Christensenellales bacterium]
MKRLLAIILLAALLMGFQGASGGSAPEGFELAAQNELLSLYVDRASGRIILEDRQGGFLWRSNPEGNDKKAKGIHRQTLLSQLMVSYTNERGTDLSLSSNADAVTAGGLSMAFQPEGLGVTYDFQKARIRITVRYTLADDHLIVRVPVEEIVSYPDEAGNASLNTVTAIDLLPLMGAGGAGEEGWLLIPDGSGALIRFNNGVTSMPEYSAPVYGPDNGVEGQIALSDTLARQARTRQQTARLPVFGVYHEGGHGLLGVVTDNDAKAAILARVSNLTSYNYAWSRFRLRSSGSMMMNSKEFGSSVIGVSEREGLTRGTYEVRYYPLRGDQSGYAGMAARYRAYLQAEGGLRQRVREGEYPLYLELFGLMKKPAQFLGIPYTKTVTLTSLGDVRRVVEALQVPGSVVRYANWIPNTAYEKMPASAALSGKLGSLQEMEKLAADLEAAGGGLYPAVDLVNVYQNGNGFWAIRDAVLAPVNAPQMQFQTSFSSRAVNTAIPPWYLLSPARYERFFERFFRSFQGTAIDNLALDAIGDICTSDNRSGGTGRGEVPVIVRGVLRQADKRLMLAGGNAYAAALATHLLSAPGGSSGYSLQDETIPFYQMVFHGQIAYGIGDVNHSSDPKAFLLRCLEYGASPQYAFVGRNAQELADSRLVWLYSPDWQAWTEEARASYGTLQAILGPLATLPITGHQNLTDHCALTVYGGKTEVYVNYGEADQAVGDLIIPAGAYLVREVAGDAQ